MGCVRIQMHRMKLFRKMVDCQKYMGDINSIFFIFDCVTVSIVYTRALTLVERDFFCLSSIHLHCLHEVISLYSFLIIDFI